MSRDDSPEREAQHEQPRTLRPGVPTNAELAQRITRVEEGVEHVGDTVERIEENLEGTQADQSGRVDDLEPKVSHLWTVWTLGKWAAPATGTIIGGLAAVGVL